MGVPGLRLVMRQKGYLLQRALFCKRLSRQKLLIPRVWFPNCSSTNVFKILPSLFSELNFFNSPLSVYICINSYTFFHHFWCQEFSGCFSTWNMLSAIPKSIRSIPSAVSAFHDVLGFKASLLSLVRSLLLGLLFRHLLYPAADFNGALPHQKFTCWNPNLQGLRMWPDLETGSLQT